MLFLRNVYPYVIQKTGQRLTDSTHNLLETKQKKPQETTLRERIFVVRWFLLFHLTKTVFLEEGISPYLEDYTSFHALSSYTYQKTQGMWTVIFANFNLLKDEKK